MVLDPGHVERISSKTICFLLIHSQSSLKKVMHNFMIHKLGSNHRDPRTKHDPSLSSSDKSVNSSLTDWLVISGDAFLQAPLLQH